MTPSEDTKLILMSIWVVGSILEPNPWWAAVMLLMGVLVLTLRPSSRPQPEDGPR